MPENPLVLRNTLSATGYQIGNNIWTYFKFNSTLVQLEFMNSRNPFPTLLVCSESLHSRARIAQARGYRGQLRVLGVLGMLVSFVRY